jgi:hypothetical protein
MAVTIQEYLKQLNYYKSAASFCQLAAAWCPDMFGNFYFVKIHKNANDFKTTEVKK